MTQNEERMQRLAQDLSTEHQKNIGLQREVDRLTRLVEQLEHALTVAQERFDSVVARQALPPMRDMSGEPGCDHVWMRSVDACMKCTAIAVLHQEGQHEGTDDPQE